MAEAFPEALIVELVSSTEQSPMYGRVHPHGARGDCSYFWTSLDIDYHIVGFEKGALESLYSKFPPIISYHPYKYTMGLMFAISNNARGYRDL